MKSSFTKCAITTLGLGAFLLALVPWGAALPNQGPLEFVHELIDHARDGNPYGAGEDDGYYEALMKRSDDPPEHEKLIEQIVLNKFERSRSPWSDIYSAPPFLVFAPKPNLDLPNTEWGMVKTNSFGLFDREHQVANPFATRRVAVFGDSIPMGHGVLQEQRFSNLLENRLNESGPEHFEFLNFAVPAYFLTQTFDDVMNKAPIFHPNVYLLVISDRSVGLIWGNHLIRLVRNGESLKYDLFQTAIEKSGVTKNDSNQLATWKLAPYRQRTVREMLLRMNAHADRESARFIVALVPSVQAQPALDASFRFIRESLAGTGIPVVDVSDTYKNKDFEKLRLNWFDPHPNVLGNRMIADNLYRKLRENPEAWADLTGETETSQSVR